MKLKYLLSALAGIALFASCVEEQPVASYDLAVSLDKSIVAVGPDGTSKLEGGVAVIKVSTGEITWTASSSASWIVFDPKTGSGDTDVKITIGASDDDRSGEITIKAAGIERYITVIQTGDPHGLLEEDPLTCAEAVAICEKLADKAKTPKKYYVKGIITKIVEEFGTTYGNATFWMGDDGTADQFQVYRALYLGNAKYDDPAKQNIGVGDEVLIHGLLMNYGGTPETSQNEAYVASIKSNTDPVLSAKEATKVVPAAAESTTFEIEGKNLTEGWTVTGGADWITEFTQSGAKEDKEIKVKFAANTVEEERSATFTVKSAGAKDLVLTLKQEAYSPITDINCAGLNALEDGDAYYRVKGVITEIVMDKNDNTKYNVYGNFYIADETGVVYVYGLLPEAGGATKQDVLTTKGIKVGDVITVVGPKGSYKGNPQMVNAYYESHTPVTTTTCEAFNALTDGDDLFLLKGTIQNIVMDKNDATKYNKYGNFDVVDASGKVYVYGIVPVMTGKSGQDLLTTLGVKEGDIVTVVGPKGSYKGNPQMINGFLVGVEPAPAAGITIDGDLSDWDGIEAFTSEATSRIREWKFSSDADNVYVYAALRKNRADNGRKLVIGFDIDESGSLTDNNNLKNAEAIAKNIIPFTNDANATELALVTGVDAGSEVVATNGETATGAVTVWAIAGTEDISSDSSNAYLELSIPKAKLGLSSGTVKVGASYDYYFAGWKEVTL
ncbi:MAG: BACON domain-containing protein [Bacteroidales bacterium]|nr:BACON domain-containing protein [Bacteroidales bacterium]